MWNVFMKTTWAERPQCPYMPIRWKTKDVSGTEVLAVWSMRAFRRKGADLVSSGSLRKKTLEFWKECFELDNSVVNFAKQITDLKNLKKKEENINHWMAVNSARFVGYVKNTPTKMLDRYLFFGCWFMIVSHIQQLCLLFTCWPACAGEDVATRAALWPVGDRHLQVLGMIHLKTTRHMRFLPNSDTPNRGVPGVLW